MLLVLLVASIPATAERIALHAQSMSRLHGWVAGSEVTTRGLQAALISMGHEAEVFAPFFRRDRLAQETWDLLLIEGYSGTATQAIRTVRGGNPRAIVLHWCLDTYPNLASVAALPVDAFLTNSRYLATYGFKDAANLLDLPYSQWYASATAVPRAYVALAVDPKEMAARGTHREDDLIVYLGQPSYSKRLLADSLAEIAKINGSRLEIYGSSAAWNGFAQEDETYAELTKCCWKGALGTDEIGALYNRAAVVIGTTESAQRRLNMVNNRVFEAVLASRQFVCVEEERQDDELYQFVKDLPHVQLVHTPADAASAVTTALFRLNATSFDATDFAYRHSYTQRAETILSFARALSTSKRRRRERVAVIYDATEKFDWPWLLSYVPAFASIDDEYEFSFFDAEDQDKDWCVAAAVILARGSRAIDRALLPATNGCGAGSGGNGMSRPPSKILAFENEDSQRKCEEFLLFDVVLVYEGDEFPCNHPSIQNIVGLDLDTLRPSLPSEGRAGTLVVESSSRYHGIPETVLKSTAEIDVRGSGVFPLLAGLAAGAVVHTENPALSKILAEATAGSEREFRKRYSLDVFSSGILRAVRN